MNLNGSVVQSWRFASTTSRCAMIKIGLSFEPAWPRYLATMLPLRSLGPSTTTSALAKPASSSRCAMACAATVVLPTESVVFISMSCLKISCAILRLAASSSGWAGRTACGESAQSAASTLAAAVFFIERRLVSRDFRGGTDRHQFDRETVLMPLARLQRAYADDITGDFLALLVGDRHHNAVFALLAVAGVMNRTLDSHRRKRLGLRLRIDRIETQVMLAARTNVGALQYRRLAVRTYPGCADGAMASDAHWEFLAAVAHRAGFKLAFLIFPAEFNMAAHARTGGYGNRTCLDVADNDAALEH